MMFCPRSQSSTGTTINAKRYDTYCNIPGVVILTPK